MFQSLVHAIIGGKDLHCGSAQLPVSELRVNELRLNLLSVNLLLRLGHGCLPLTYNTSGPSATRT